jgi:GAF domain-containing protein
MLNKLQTFLNTREINDRETRSTFIVLQTVLITSLLGSSSALVTVFMFPATINARIMISAMTVLLLISFFLLRRHILLPARIMTPLALFATITFMMFTGIGVHDISIITYAGIVILASLTLGKRGAIAFAALGIIAIFSVGVAELTGKLVTAATFLTMPGDPFLISIVILAIAYLQVLIINQMNLSVADAKKNEKAQAEANRELMELKDSLEKRATEFERTSKLNARRSVQFEFIAQVAHSIAALEEQSKVLPHISNMIATQFGFYHVGIFLLDEKEEYVILRAANSPGGRRLIEHGYRLRVGDPGLVETAAASSTFRIALDAGPGSVTFNNPDLPETRSEIALPLKTAGRVIGILDIQSSEPFAFSNEDIATLSVLADQVAIAIENSRLFEQTQKSLKETVSAYRKYLQNEWASLAHDQKIAGFQYVDGNSVALDAPLDLGEIGETVTDGNLHQTEAAADGTPAQLALPIKLRGEVIGILHLSTAQKSGWSDDDIDIAEAVAERLALSIENARLFLSSTNRAARERIVSDISSKISGNIRIENILRLAAQELSQALNGSDVLIQLQSPNRPAGVEE